MVPSANEMQCVGHWAEAWAKVAAKYYYSSLSPEASNADLESVDRSPNSFRSAK